MIDETAARELDLYAENTSELYGQFKSIIENVKRRIESGKYDASKAPKLWGYWYEAAARRYVKEIGGDVRTQFPAALRAHLSKERAADEYKKILAGEYGPVTPGEKATGAKRARPKRSGTKRAKSSRGKKTRALRRLRHTVKKRGWGVLRHGKTRMIASIQDAPVWGAAQQAKYSVPVPTSGSQRELLMLVNMLRRAGYDTNGAKKLHAEGMGPYELEERLKVPPGEVGSLSYTHGIDYWGK